MHSAVYMYFRKCVSNQRSTVEIKRNQRSKPRKSVVVNGQLLKKGGQTVIYGRSCDYQVHGSDRPLLWCYAEAMHIALHLTQTHTRQDK